jgi:multidrug efflux pump subunit AcrA (membrane-fusion protein)
MRASAEVAEAEAGRLAVGQPVRFTLDAHPGRSYRATVRKIGRTVERRSWRDPRKVVRLELELESTDTERMRPGMRLEGAVEVQRSSGVLAIPLATVVPRPEGPAVRVRSVFGLRRFRWEEVELGRRTKEWVEVLSGLDEGDHVLRQGDGS